MSIRHRGTFVCLVLSALLLVTPALGANSAPTFVATAPAGPYGTTYPELAARWWQWALQTPAPVNPLVDTDRGALPVGPAGQGLVPGREPRPGRPGLAHLPSSGREGAVLPDHQRVLRRVPERSARPADRAGYPRPGGLRPPSQAAGAQPRRPGGRHGAAARCPVRDLRRSASQEQHPRRDEEGHSRVAAEPERGGRLLRATIASSARQAHAPLAGSQQLRQRRRLAGRELRAGDQPALKAAGGERRSGSIDHA